MPSVRHWQGVFPLSSMCPSLRAACALRNIFLGHARARENTCVSPSVCAAVHMRVCAFTCTLHCACPACGACRWRTSPGACSSRCWQMCRAHVRVRRRPSSGSSSARTWYEHALCRVHVLRHEHLQSVVRRPSCLPSFPTPCSAASLQVVQAAITQIALGVSTPEGRTLQCHDHGLSTPAVIHNHASAQHLHARLRHPRGHAICAASWHGFHTCHSGLWEVARPLCSLPQPCGEQLSPALCTLLLCTPLGTLLEPHHSTFKPLVTHHGKALPASPLPWYSMPPLFCLNAPRHLCH